MSRLYENVTQDIIADLKKGVLPWQKNWKNGNPTGLDLLPCRHSGETYRGINIVILWNAARKKGFSQAVWMTYRQALEYGGQVRKGQKGTTIVYANKLTKTETNDSTGEEVEREIPYLKGYTVFNVEQIDGLPERFYTKPEPVLPLEGDVQRIEALEEFFRNTGARIKNGGDEAFLLAVWRLYPNASG